jgi:hypothetical protein
MGLAGRLAVGTPTEVDREHPVGPTPWSDSNEDEQGG